MSKRYGLLTTNTDNVGDEIQSIAVKKFIPSVDFYLDRDKINLPPESAGQPVHAILNGWWCHSPENWPPASTINPLIVSFHLSPFRSPSLGLIPSEILLAEPAVRYLRAHAPIGARDLGTLELLRKAKVESYFSGCMTLTISRRNVEREDDLIVINDVPTDVTHIIKSRTKKRVIQTQHAGYGYKSLQERFVEAEGLLSLYSKASTVITTRLHCALPCVAMGTPVLLLDTADDPKRFSGLHEFVHHLSISEYLASTTAYDVNRPPPNLDEHLPHRSALIASAQAFVSGSETDKKAYVFSELERVSIQNRTLSEVSSRITYLQNAVKARRLEETGSTPS